jgi:glycine cleavage system H protein
MEIPKDLRYTSEHEWVKSSGDVMTMGITDYAQQQLGDVVYVEMPEPGSRIAKGERYGVVESVKAASDIFAPIGGEIIEIHQELDEHPEYINQSPFEKGWIVKVKASEPGEIETLMDHEAYRLFLQKESEKC